LMALVELLSALRATRRERGAIGLPPALSLLASLVRRTRIVARLGLPRELDARVAAAGLGGVLEARTVMAAKVGAALAAGAAGPLLASALPGRIGILLAALLPVVGFLAPDAWLSRLTRERARRVGRELPALLDLLRVTTGAGMSLTGALRVVGEGSTGLLAGELRSVGAQTELGVPLADALLALMARVPTADVTALVASLERAARHGAPLGETLAAQARGLRELRAQRIREQSARAGPKIQLAVALLLVPSVLLMVAAALATALLGQEGGVPVL
jgi:tight adherence protein C